MVARTSACTAAVLMIAVTVAIGGCGQEESDSAAKPLICHVGGTMRPVMKELAKRYEAQSGQPVEINSAGSGELLAHIEGQKSGDLYVCHSPFQPMLFKKHSMGVDGWVVAELTPVIVVSKGNPKKIAGVGDLARPDVRLALTHLEYSTLGRMLPMIFGNAKLDLQDVLKQKEVQIHRGGGHVAGLVQTGNADAAMCWNAVAHLRRADLDVVTVGTPPLPKPNVDTITSATGKVYALRPVAVNISTLTCSGRPAAARAFAEYVASADAQNVFEQFGFTLTAPRQLYAGGTYLGEAE